jgi:hypothetical protein
MALFIEILQRFPPGHLLDLGTGHGIFARLAADIGWKVTAMDARETRFPNDSRIQWVHEDVRNFDIAGYDVISCLGLWYHLTLDDQLDIAKRAQGTPLVIDTHFAKLNWQDHLKSRKVLSRRLVKDRGYEGRLYNETDLQDRNTASFHNLDSFWPTEQSLRQLLQDAGYDIIEDVRPDVTHDRRFFVANSIDQIRGERLDELIGKYMPLAEPTPTPASSADAG